MKNPIENKIFLLSAITALFIALGYAYTILDDPRMLDGGLEFGEASNIEIIIIMLAPISGVTMWILATIHSFRSRRIMWGILTFIAWPIAFLYAVMVNYVWSNDANSENR